MIVLKGIDHHAAFAEREAFIAALDTDVAQPHVYLQTCDRAELYYGEGQPAPGVAQHLFRVAAGLESRLVGETAIQGQVRNAYRAAVRAGHVTSGLHQLFQSALRVGKQVRSRTGISRGAVSHARALLALLDECSVAVANTQVVLVGANPFSEQLLAVLHKSGCRAIEVTNRTFGKARELSRRYGCRSFPLDELAVHTPRAGVVISAVSAPEPVVRWKHIAAQGRERALVLIDFGVPRTIDPELAGRPGVVLKNIEDVERHGARALRQRRGAIEAAETIIIDAVARLHGVDPLSRAA